MAIDPTAPLIPITPSAPAGAAPDSLALLQAMARQALASTAAELGQIVGRSAAPQAPRTGAPVEQAGKTSTEDAARADDAVNSNRGGASPQPAPAARGSSETRMTRAVRMAAAEAVPRQAGLAPLMANVRAVLDRHDMPNAVREAGGALLAMTPHADQLTTAQGLRRAVERSGVFLEARMARAAAMAVPAGPPPHAPAGDMKAALLVFRGALSAWLAHATPRDVNDLDAEPITDAGPDVEIAAPHIGLSKAVVSPPTRPATQAQASPAAPVDDAPGELPSTAPAPRAEVVEEERAAPGISRVPVPAAEEEPIAPRFAAFTAAPEPRPGSTTAARAALSPLIQAGLLAEDAVAEEPTTGAFIEARTVATRGYGASAPDAARSKLPPPPYASGPMAGQKPTPPILSAEESLTEVVRDLLKGANGALARQDLMQIASLPEQRHGEAETAEARPQGSRLNLDLPFVTSQGVAVAQLEISHDGGGSGGGATGPVERTYKARFSIDVEPLGPVHALITLTGARARVSLWAERSETIARLRAGEESLGAALRQAELTPEVAIHSGAPSSAGGASPLGHFVDQAS